jgi:hypothetical protein
MPRLPLACLAVVLMSTSCPARDSQIERSLRLLDPATRLEQVCNYEAMQRIRRDPNRYRPDRVVADAVSQAEIKDTLITASGGAFRSRRKWYRFSFTCLTSPDRMKVLSFKYQLGPPIPEDKWSAYGLWR